MCAKWEPTRPLQFASGVPVQRTLRMSSYASSKESSGGRPFAEGGMCLATWTRKTDLYQSEGRTTIFDQKKNIFETDPKKLVRDSKQGSRP